MLICVSVPRMLLLASSYFIEVLLGLEPWEHGSAGVWVCSHACKDSSASPGPAHSPSCSGCTRLAHRWAISKRRQTLLGSVLEKKGWK